MKCYRNTIEQGFFARKGRALTWALALTLAPLAAPLADSAYSDGVEAARVYDYRTAFEKWEPLVARNDGRAQFQLAMMYHAGLHVVQDERKAVELYHLAARNGVQEAREYLIAGYANGWFGLPRDESLAAYWQDRLEMQNRDTARKQAPSTDPHHERGDDRLHALAQATPMQ